MNKTSKATKGKLKPKRIQVNLDDATLGRLSEIAKKVPDINSRSAAIRYASRITMEILEKTA